MDFQVHLGESHLLFIKSDYHIAEIKRAVLGLSPSLMSLVRCRGRTMRGHRPFEHAWIALSAVDAFVRLAQLLICAKPEVLHGRSMRGGSRH